MIVPMGRRTAELICPPQRTVTIALQCVTPERTERPDSADVLPTAESVRRESAGNGQWFDPAALSQTPFGRSYRTGDEGRLPCTLASLLVRVTSRDRHRWPPSRVNGKVKVDEKARFACLQLVPKRGMLLPAPDSGIRVEAQ